MFSLDPRNEQQLFIMDERTRQDFCASPNRVRSPRDTRSIGAIARPRQPRRTDPENPLQYARTTQGLLFGVLEGRTLDERERFSARERFDGAVFDVAFTKVPGEPLF